MKITNVKAMVAKMFTVGLVAAAIVVAAPTKAQAQVTFGVRVGPPVAYYGGGYSNPSYDYRNPQYGYYGRDYDRERHEAMERRRDWERREYFEHHRDFDRDRDYDRRDRDDRRDYRDRDHDRH